MLPKIVIVVLSLFSLNYVCSIYQLRLDEDLLRRIPRETHDSPNRSRDDDFNTLIKTNEYARRMIWSNVITSMVNEDCNVSMVGWKHIYDSDGNIKKLESLELAFPIKSKIHLVSKDDKNPVERFSTQEIISQFKMLVEISEISDQADVFVMQQKRDGEIFNYVYMNTDTMYYRHKDWIIFNKTQIGSFEDAAEFDHKVIRDRFAKYNRSFYLRETILPYGADGTFNPSQKVMDSPSVMSYVTDFKNVTSNVLLDSPMIMAKIATEYSKEEIPEQLAKKFNEKFKERDWRVLVNPGNFRLKGYGWIKLSTDPFEFYDGHKDVYMVYGVLRVNETTKK